MASKSFKGDIKNRIVVTPAFRVGFPAVFEPRAGQDGGVERYSIEMYFPKSLTKFGAKDKATGKRILNPLEKVVRQAKIDEWGADPEKWPKKDGVKGGRSPFTDGDKKFAEEGEEKPYMETYKGMTVVRASATKTAPVVVGPSLKPILSAKDFRAGHWARAELIAMAYDISGNIGVKFVLRSLQKLPPPEGFDDAPFGGGNANPFDAVECADEDDSENPDNYDLGDDESDED